MTDNFFALIGFSNAIFSFLPALYVYIKGPRKPMRLSFMVFALSVALWSLFYGIWQLQTDKAAALFYARLLIIPTYYTCASFLWFVLELTENPYRKKYYLFCLLFPLFFTAFSFTPLIIPDVVPRINFAYWPVPGILIHGFVVIFFLTVIWSFVLLIRTWHSASGQRRKVLAWITWTMILAWGGGSTNWFLWYGIPIPPVANIFVSVNFLLLAYGIIRLRMFDIDALPDIIRSAKLASMGIMAASLSHEIRNPLYIAKGTIENYLSRAESVPSVDSETETVEARKALQKTLTQIDRAFVLLQKFVSRARMVRTEQLIESVSFDEAVDQTIAMVFDEKSTDTLQVKKDYEDSIKLMVDRSHLEEIICNLLMNARDAIGQNSGVITVKAMNLGNRVEIRIMDTGCGIAPENLGKVFEPFYTTKGKTSQGLGLYIIQQLVKRNRGTISVSSKPEFGTTFTLNFQAA